MRWDQITIVNEGRNLTGDAARIFASKRYPDCVNTSLKKIVVLNRQACAKYSPGGSGHGSHTITDDLTVGAILRAWFGETLVLPSSAKEEIPRKAEVQRKNANLLRRNPPVLRMFLDADRDGTVDADPPDHKKWTWGENGYGAILMVMTREWADGDVVPERAPIEFDWQNGKADNWQAQLSVDFPERIQIYRDNTAGAELLLGPGRHGPLDLIADGAISTDLTAPRRVRLWMNAPDYPQSQAEADWIVKLTFKYEDAFLKRSQEAVLRITPWIMASDLDPTHTVYVRDILDDDLTAVVPLVDFRMKETQQRARYVNTLANYLAGQIGGLATVQRMKLAANSDEKGFMRDVMMFGYTASPSHNRIVYLHELEERSPLMPLTTSIQRADTNASAIQRPRGLAAGDRQGQDNGGNYLVSPKRTGYEYGRIIYGDREGGGLCHAGPFLKQQRIQNPIVLDSTWLDVGHVDEFLSFVPDYGGGANPAKPFKVLIASPRLAYLMLWATARQLTFLDGADIDLAISHALAKNREYYNRSLVYGSPDLRMDSRFAVMGDSAGPDLPAQIAFATALNPTPPVPANADGKVIYYTTAVHGDRMLTRLWPGQDTRPLRYTQDGGITLLQKHRVAQSSLLELRKDIRRHLEVLAADWRKALEEIQPKLNVARQILKVELELEDADFIEVPVMLHSSEGGKIFFDSPDCVNLLALNGGGACTCLVPKPFGPVLNGEYVFEKYLGEQLRAFGLTVQFINDLPFSLNHGEIHCGTNQRHQPLSNPRWWRHKPPNIR